jgi:hypothetical protein
MSVRSPNATKIGRGTYSAIVYQDGDLCVAEDDVGTIIKEDTDAATVIQAAIDALAKGTLLIKKGDYSIPSANINWDTDNHKINIVGEGCFGYVSDDTGTKLSFSNTHGIYITGNGWFNQIRDIWLVGDGTGKAISNDTPVSNINYLVFENINIKNFATGIELNNVVACRFRDIFIRDTVKSFRILGNSYTPYLEFVACGYGATSEEGIYIEWAERASLICCDGGDATTYTFKVGGFGIFIDTPYNEAGSGPMRLKGSNIKVLGGVVRSNVYIGDGGTAQNIYLDMVSYYTKDNITFTVDAAQDSMHIVIDTGPWSPTVTDTNHRALIRTTSYASGADKNYIKYSGAGHHFNDLLAIPTTLPTYGLIAGTMYFDTSTKVLKVYDGAAWKSVTLS